MDPGSLATALQIAFSCAEGAWAVYQFLQAAKNIDLTAAGFVSEIETLAIACDAVGDLVKDRDQQRRVGLERLWRCLQGRLEACEATVAELEVAVAYVVDGSKQKHNFFSPIIRQIYLNGKGKDIENARIQIRAHTTSLQIVLQVVGINVSYLATGAIDMKLPAELQRLRGATQELERIRGQREWRAGPTLDDNEAELLRVGNEVLSSGETLYAASLAGSTYGKQTSTTAGAAHGRESSIAAHMSVYGGATPEKLQSTSTWLKDQAVLEKLPSMSSSPDTGIPSVFSQQRAARLSSTGNSLVSDNLDTPRAIDTIASASPPMPELYSDSDDEDEIEHVQAAIRSGRSLFQAKKYREATARLQVAVKLIRRLPNKRGGVHDLPDLQYMLAVCSFHVQQPADAFDALLNVLTGNVDATEQTDESILRTLQATHLLAITCVRLGKMTHARSYCKAARKGRRKALKKDSLPYFESVALMAKIEELEGNQDDAEILMDMIPEEQRQHLDPAIQELTINTTSRRDSHSTGMSVPQTGETAFTNADPLQDINFLLEKNLDLKLDSKSNSKTAEQNLTRADTTTTATRVPSFPLEEHLTYDDYRNPALRSVAHSMGYVIPAPADLITRRTWKIFLDIKPKKDDRLTEALLANQRPEAFKIAHSQNQTRQRLWHGAGASPISRKDLHLAALFGEVEIVDRLLRCGANAKFKWNYDLTPLHCAAMGGYREIAAKLIDAGCPCDSVSERFGTPLSLAALGQKIDVLDLLLANTSALLAETSYLGSAIHATAVTGNTLLLDALTRGKGGLGIPRVFYPAHLRKLHHILATHTLLDPVDDALLAPHTDVRLERIEAPALACAAYMGSIASVEYLLAQPEVEMNAPCKAETAIHNSLRAGSTQHTALTLASMAGNNGIVRTLLTKQAVMKSANYEHADPLFLAVMNEKESTALLLLEHEARVRSKTLEMAMKKSMRRLIPLMRAKAGSQSSSLSSAKTPSAIEVRSLSSSGMKQRAS